MVQLVQYICVLAAGNIVGDVLGLSSGDVIKKSDLSISGRGYSGTCSVITWTWSLYVRERG